MQASPHQGVTCDVQHVIPDDLLEDDCCVVLGCAVFLLPNQGTDHY